MLERINHPDLTKNFSPSERQFGVGAASNDKKAAIKPFAFSKSANVRDGFRTRNFAGAKLFGTKEYAGNKDAAVAKRTFGQTDRAFATRDVAVRDAPEASKTMGVKTYTNTKEPRSWPRGKSQGYYDDLLARKNLDIDQVRELLNKNK